MAPALEEKMIASARSAARKALVLGALMAPLALPAEAAPGIPRPDTAVTADILPVHWDRGYGYGYRRPYYPPPPPPYYYRRPVYGYGWGYPPPRPRYYGYYRPHYYYR